MSDTIQHYVLDCGGVLIYVEMRYLRPHFYSYLLMPSMMGAGVLGVLHMLLKRVGLS